MKRFAASLKINWITYLVAFGITVFLAFSLLLASAFLDQEEICKNILESIETASLDISGNYIFDRSDGSKLDVGTDLMMLRTSISTNRRYLGAVLTNPIYVYDGLSEWDDIDETLARLAYDMPHDDVWFYARYWMGFRSVLRLLLVFFNYAQIKRYLAFCFFVLMAAAMSSVSKNIDSKAGFLFALSIILVRPHVMATSMQFTCCFIIAFLTMLLVPWLNRNERYDWLYFMEIGMITMYFDFYTVPVITVGLPLVYLVALRMESGEIVSMKRIGGYLLVWLCGYVFMWLAKLALTDVLTSVEAFKQGFISFFGRIGIKKDVQLESYYSVSAAFDAVMDAVFSDKQGKTVYLQCGFGLTMFLLLKAVREHVTWKRVVQCLSFVLIALLPIGWFVVTKQPVAIHGYFQYRSIALTYWALGIFVHSVFKKTKCNSSLEAKNSASL